MGNTKNLVCNHFEISRSAGELVKIRASFALDINPRDNEEITKAVARINELFSGRISLVQGQNKPRCTYCGTLQKDSEVICLQCGGNL